MLTLNQSIHVYTFPKKASSLNQLPLNHGATARNQNYKTFELIHPYFKNSSAEILLSMSKGRPPLQGYMIAITIISVWKQNHKSWKENLADHLTVCLDNASECYIYCPLTLHVNGLKWVWAINVR